MQRRLGGTDLHDRTVRTQVPSENDECAALVERFATRSDHFGVDDPRTRDVLPDRTTRDRDHVGREEIVDLRHDSRDAPGVVEVLHQEATRRLEVDQPRRRRAELVEQLERQLDTDPARVGE